MKTELTTQQAITLYSVIEALCNQFDADNLRRAALPSSDGSSVTPPLCPLRPPCENPKS
jgi:hypothetical protein